MKKEDLTLKNFIAKNYYSQSDFARRQGVKRAQITQWINKEMIVINGILYSKRRKLKEHEK